jgi:hypothetical protein
MFSLNISCDLSCYVSKYFSLPYTYHTDVVIRVNIMLNVQ